MHRDSTPFRVIPLTGGKSMLVDLADVDIALAHKWQARKNKGRGKSYYVCRTVKRKRLGLPATTVYIHRLLLDAPPGVEVDHINGNPLDNRRANIRICTTSQNHGNMRQPQQRKNNLPYKGVRPLTSGRWQARIGHQRKQYDLGSFDTVEEAARAYDAKALELFGSFARLNFPDASA